MSLYCFLGNENFVLFQGIFDGDETEFFIVLAGLWCHDDPGGAGQLVVGGAGGHVGEDGDRAGQVGQWQRFGDYCYGTAR